MLPSFNFGLVIHVISLIMSIVLLFIYLRYLFTLLLRPDLIVSIVYR